LRALALDPLELLELVRCSYELIKGRDALPHQHRPSGGRQMEVRNGSSADFVTIDTKRR
jgi:hypothetical protein